MIRQRLLNLDPLRGELDTRGRIERNGALEDVVTAHRSVTGWQCVDNDRKEKEDE
jgi:hypothetical protein